RMPETRAWAFPAHLQPTPEALRFDLDDALASMVMLRAQVPDDAFTAGLLGTERHGNGVVIRDDGLVLTIGYLIVEAESVWLTTQDGTVMAAHPLAYDFATGFGLLLPLNRGRWPALERAPAATAGIGDELVVLSHGGREHALKTLLVA